jgi:hypothetical protein
MESKMSFIDNIRNYFTRARRQPLPPVSMRLPGGRASVDAIGTFPTAQWLFVPPDNYETNWQLLTIDSKALERMDPTKLMEILADLSPEVSRALWDFLRMCNPGWEVKAYRKGGDTEDENAKAAIDAFIKTMEIDRKAGTFDVVIGRLFTAAFLRGALCAELVLDEQGRMPLDLAIPDPSSIRFQRKTDPVLGQVWQSGQWQAYNFVVLDRPTFAYVPIDPMPGKPYGRPLAAPALFVSLFLLGMLHDLKRVIQQQGYPRLDLSVDIEQLVKLAPQIASNAQAFKQFTGDIIASVEDAYRQLKPDDAYIHTSNIMVNRPVGTVDANLAGLDSIIAMLERMCVRALKTMPLMLGITETTGDIQSNRQFEIFSAGIKSIQHYTETLLGRLFTLALEAQGIQADVEFEFAEFRASEALRDAQTEQLKILNEKEKVANGWITDDEASETIAGHKAKGTKAAPPPMQAPNQPGVGNTDGQPSQQQEAQRWLTEIRAARADVAKAMEMVSYNGYH